MDEQNPRVTAAGVSSRGDDRMTGYDRDSLEHPGRDASEVWGTQSLRTDRNPATVDAPTETRTHELRAEIAQTRDELSETVNAIQNRLRPSTIAAEAADGVKRAALNTAREVGDSEPVVYARANPIPTAMVAIGVAGAAWLAMAGRDGRGTRRERAGGANGDPDAPSRRGGYATPDRAGGSNTSRQIGSSGSDLSNPYSSPADHDRQGRVETDRWSHRGSVSDRLAQALPDRRTLRGAWDQSPLLIGAVAALVGAVVGLSVPETEREHQLMGETRDALVDTVQDTVRDKVNQVQQAASDAVTTVQNIAGITGTGSAQDSESGS